MGKLNVRNGKPRQEVQPRHVIEESCDSSRVGRKTAGTELLNHVAKFKARDIHLPNVEEVLLQMYGDDILQGRVVDVSDNGTPDGVFVVIELPGLDGPVIVSAKKLQASSWDA